MESQPETIYQRLERLGWKLLSNTNQWKWRYYRKGNWIACVPVSTEVDILYYRTPPTPVESAETLSKY